MGINGVEKVWLSHMNWEEPRHFQDLLFFVAIMAMICGFLIEAGVIKLIVSDTLTVKIVESGSCYLIGQELLFQKLDGIQK